MRKLFKKKAFAFMTVAALTASLFTGCSSSESGDSAKAEKLKVTIGVQDTDISAIVAYKNGYYDEVFKEQNINAEVELVMFDAGPAIMEAFSANSLDFGCLGDQPCISALATGCPAEIIGTYRTQKTGTAIIANRKSGINTPADLKGKRVGLTLGSNAEHLLNILLADYSLTQNDVEIISLEQGDMLTTLENGDIDAAAVWEPRITKSSEFAFRLADGQGVYDIEGNHVEVKDYKYFCNPFAVNTVFSKAHADVTSAVLKALEKGAKYTDDNTSEAIDILAGYTNVDSAAASASVNCEKRDVALNDEKINAFKATIEFLISVGKIDTSSDICSIKTPDDISKFINTSYYEAIK